MTPKEALELLDKIAQAYTGNRADHVKLQQAIQALDELVNPKKK